jgi:hypothetical protein
MYPYRKKSQPVVRKSTGMLEIRHCYHFVETTCLPTDHVTITIYLTVPILFVTS